MVSHWSLNENKSSKVSRTLLSILADLNNAVVWMFSTRPVISKFPSPRTNLLVTVPRAPMTIGFIVIFMVQSFFQFPNKIEVFIPFSYSFNLTLCSAGTVKSPILQVLFFFVIITSGRYLSIHLSICFWKLYSCVQITCII